MCVCVYVVSMCMLSVCVRKSVCERECECEYEGACVYDSECSRAFCVYYVIACVRVYTVVAQYPPQYIPQTMCVVRVTISLSCGVGYACTRDVSQQINVTIVVFDVPGVCVCAYRRSYGVC